MADVKFTGTSDFQKVKRDYEQLAAQTAKVENENRKLRQESERVGRAFSRVNSAQQSVLSKGIQGAKGLALQYLGVQQAIALVVKEMQAQKALAEESANRTMTLAQSQAAVIKNLGDVSDEVARKFLTGTEQAARGAGLPSVVPVNQAASSILSAVGGNRQQTLEILRAAAPLFRDRPEEMAQFGGALGDVMKSAGGMGALDTAALMLAIQGQARFESLASFKEVSPALAAGNVVTRGDQARNVRETAALFAAIGSRAGDVEGAQTKTAVANLVANLAEVAPDLNTTFERLRRVQADPTLQAEVTKSGFKGSIKPIIQELVRGEDTKTAQMLSDAFAQIQGSTEAFNRKIDQLTGLTPALQIASRSQAAESNIERAMLAPAAAREGAARDIMRKTLERTHGTGVSSIFGGLDDFSRQVEFLALRGMGVDPVEAAAEQLRIRRAALRGRWSPDQAALGRALTSSELTGVDPTNVRLIRLIEAQLEELRGMRSDARQGNTSNANRRAQQLERQAVVAE